MKELDTTEAVPHMVNVMGELHELIDHMRRDAQRVADPRAAALFETSAEVLAGLERAFGIRIEMETNANTR
ncbi:MAG TPA: hypothetical protein VFQ53_41385 [Kofleriaceae bacterium]|nr:hypothetical protein [Kofleriaceae bacterium]